MVISVLFSKTMAEKPNKHKEIWRDTSIFAQRALRDRLMSRGKNCLPTVSRQFLTRNYPRPNCFPKCLPNCLSPTREGFLSSFKINPAVRVIARQVRDRNCLAAIFAPRHQDVSLLAHWVGIADILRMRPVCPEEMFRLSRGDSVQSVWICTDIRSRRPGCPWDSPPSDTRDTSKTN